MKNSQRYARLALATLTLFFAGILYAWTMLYDSLLVLFKEKAVLDLTFTITLCFFCLGGLLSGVIGNKVSRRIRMLAGAALFAGGFIITSQLSGNSEIALYISYGFMVGTGIGIIYNVVIPTTSAWFPDKKGVASGVMMMGFGLSTLGLGNLATTLIKTSLGLEKTFLIYGIAIGALLAIAAFFIRPPQPGEVPIVEVKQSAAAKLDIAPRQMIARPSFWLLFAFLTILGAIGSTAIGSAKQFMGKSFESPEAVMALAASMAAVCNGLGRIICGTLFDKIGMRKTQYVNCAIVLVAPLLAIIAIKANAAALGFISLCLCGITFGFAPTVTSAFVLDFYGVKNFALNFPIMTLTLIPASFFKTITSGMEYITIFIIMLALAGVATVVNLLIRKA